MTINSLKELQKLIQLCRKEGIDAFEIGDIKFNLGAKPKVQRNTRSVADDFPEASIKIPTYIPTSTQDIVKTDELTDEQLLFYSARVDETESQG